MTQSEFSEVYIPEESLLRVEDVYREIDTEKKVQDKQGVVQLVPEKIIVADHAPWCKHPDAAIGGLAASMDSPGIVRWRDSHSRVKHICQSTEAARRLGKLGALARWGNTQ